MEDRCAMRPDLIGFSVYDQTTGGTFVIAVACKSALSREDAERTAALPAHPVSSDHAGDLGAGGLGQAPTQASSQTDRRYELGGTRPAFPTKHR